MTLHDVLDLDEFHAETEVGLVRAVIFHGVLPSHTEERLLEVDALDLAEECLHEALEDIQDVLLLNEAHLAVNLGELRLTVGAEVLIAETLDNLEVTIEACDHEQLLEGLRALRQCVELAGVHAAWHNEVACALGG